MLQWFKSFPRLKLFPLFVMWGIWRACNILIFEDSIQSQIRVSIEVLSYFNEFYRAPTNKSSRLIHDPKCTFGFPYVYFDDASKDILCGQGMVIKMDSYHYFLLRMSYGYGSNS